MKKHLICPGVLLVFGAMIVLTACQTGVIESAAQVPTETNQAEASATAEHQVSLTATMQPGIAYPLETPTQSPASTKTPRNTPTVITATPTPSWEMPDGITGTIYYQSYKERYQFTAWNLSTGNKEYLHYPILCESIFLESSQSLLPMRTDILCKTKDRLYLFNLVTRELVDIPIIINSPEWILGYSANGSHIFALEPILDSAQTIHLYNIETEEQLSVDINLPFSSKGIINNPVINTPALSADGKNLAFLVYDGVYQGKLVIYSLENGTILVPTEQDFAGGIQWAPKSQTLVFGTWEPIFEPGPPQAEKYYLFDTEEQRLIELPLAQDLITFGFFYANDETIWSPDEKFLLVVGVSADEQSEYVMPCIVNTQTLLISCSHDWGGTLGWSPDGKHWAMYSARENLFRIYSSIDNPEISLDYDGIYSLAWR